MARRHISGSRTVRQTAQELDSRYFWANGAESRMAGLRSNWTEARKSEEPKTTTSATRSRVDAITTTTEQTLDAPSHSPRPRRRRKTANDDIVPELPQDASSALSSIAASAAPLSLRRRMATYLALTKPRLAFLVVLTTTASYSLYPVPSLLSTAATHTPSLSSLTLLFLTTGTFSTIACANTLNMLFETNHDAKMSRTRNRPLVRGLVSSRSAVIFALAAGAVGTGILWYGVNPTTAMLGAANAVLYACIYTPLKRIHPVNTWIGAIVGGIPPLMGWCAAGGHYMTSSSPQSLLDEASALLFSPASAGGWLLAALLFAWQFPHFNALSHPIRHEYLAAGYRMLVSLNPRMNTRVALRYSLLMFPICIGLSYVNVTDRYFILTSSAMNGWMAVEAFRYWRSGGGETKTAVLRARGLFWASVWHLPIVLVLALLHKKGLWDGVVRSVGHVLGLRDGEEEEDEWEWVDDE
ncbi:UbiA prenyltransferase [Aureobasidium subglaciale]|nr:UbiA prenyltransferase [Aureobasidium subglaciale]KAI5214955.1 UbiA prenyltransferase [Aureobasidium subglaciale]KAI5218116.1 UbiA prenyltransferase [Aureobasidium subglaciale]KAI5255828.1 UbiA prenyltransferase [Aureobasidium subglaciale]